MNFQTLKQGYQTELEKIEKSLMNFPWENKAAYANWCAQTYYYVCHSTRLLALSASRIPLHEDKLYYRYLKHLQEEMGHEKLAFRDLERLGYSLRDFPELPITASFYQTQYYYIEHVNAFSLYGYILILEGLSAVYGMQCYQRALKAHGAESSSFWKVHAEEDPDHVDKAFEYIQKIGESGFAPISQNLAESRSRYADLLDTCAATNELKKSSAA